MSEDVFDLNFSIQRGSPDTETKMEKYTAKVDENMVVLDAIFVLQATQVPDLGVRWNCKAGKCGSCGVEINGVPKLMCMTRIKDLDRDATVIIKPMKTFPLIKDLVTDVSWNYEVNKKIKPFTPAKDEDFVVQQLEVERVQEFRKCIECFLCQDVCHVLRDHQKKDDFAGPRYFVRLASLEMHPLDIADRIPEIRGDLGLGYCNITKCCTEVCPENIPITDEAMIALKERVVDRYYDPVKWFLRKLRVIK